MKKITAGKILSLLMLASIGASAQKLVQHSYLEIYDTRDGSVRLVEKFAERIEAPNWTSDGKYLIYNSQGKMYRISAEGGSPELIPTGEARACNNDHVLSPDGKEIGVSSVDKARGGSVIYIVPFATNQARLITPQGPSYLHGWSPDRKTLTFTGARGEKKGRDLDIYTIGVDGKNEKRLTDAPGLDDGSEYSPDGKYIWFNSVRTGLMQIWRMKADGSEQKQIIDEKDRNSWFPHLSPDGKQVVYISYKKGDVAPDEHPRDRHVEIRRISPTGGEPEVLLKFFGGQGSFNVNSWAPDSKRFAYVRYDVVQ